MESKCELCDKIFKYQSVYDKHASTKSHLHKVKMRDKILDKEKEKEILKQSTKFKIKMKNNKNQIVAETLVDEEVFHHIIDNDLSVHFLRGYAVINYYENIIKKTCGLNRYVYYIFYKNTVTPNMYIDHKFNNKLDNRLKNLREITPENNNKNKLKSKNAHSKYYGVSKHYDNWQCDVKYNNHRYRYNYIDETHAAYHYDLMIKQFNLQKFNKFNNIEKPNNFVLKVHKDKKENLPKGIYHEGNKYSYSVHTKHYYGYNNLKDVIDARDNHIKRENIKKEKEFLETPIIRNSKGEAIIALLNKKKIKIGETVVSDEDYYNIKRYAWSLTSEIYVHGYVNHKVVLLSRFIMNCTNSKLYVDHEDGDPMNNKRSNLRILTAAENSQNNSSNKNSSSKYVGVSFDKRRNKWYAKLVLNGKYIINKRYATELEAADARDQKIIELNKTMTTYFKINLDKNKITL
jgi:uncharacterized C2H2 Zn-finger protein